MNKVNFKSIIKFILKAAPCILLMYFCSNQSYYLTKNIVKVITFIYSIYILSKNHTFTSIFLMLSNIAFCFFSNIGIQNELTYIQIFQMIVTYIFCICFNIQNLNLKKVINIKNNLINKDYSTGLYNKCFLDKLISTDFEPNIVNTNMIAIDIDDFNMLTLNYGYEGSQIILKKVAKIINKKVKNRGYCARVFGEKFVIILERRNNLNIDNLVLEIKELIESNKFYIDNKEVTICINVVATSSTNFMNHKDYYNSTMRLLENTKFNFQSQISSSNRNQWMM